MAQRRPTDTRRTDGSLVNSRPPKSDRPQPGRARSQPGRGRPQPGRDDRNGRSQRSAAAPPPPRASARAVAYQALLRIDHEGAYANLALPSMLSSSGLDDRDRKFVTDLTYGTTRMRAACDFAVDRFVLQPPDGPTRTLLRLGAYQLLFAGTPHHAAVNDTVALAPAKTRGFVNAILRKVAGSTVVWPDDATRLSYPAWIVDRLTSELGYDEAIAALTIMNQPPPVTERDDGYVQDASSQWVSELVDAQAGERIADLCAAPGGKATALAASGASVVAADVRASRVALLKGNIRRFGARADVVAADAARPPFRNGSFDRVLLDAPCSGLGVLRRRSDARWRLQASDVDDLATLQRSLIAGAAPLVRPGGLLVYSVCTLTEAESFDHPVPVGFEAIAAPGGPWRPHRDGVRVLPQDHGTDGMSVRRFRRLD